MEYSIKLHTIKSEWSIVYIEGSQVTISKNSCISFSEGRFCLANCADRDEMPLYVTFHLGLHFTSSLLPMYVFRGLQSTKG